MTASASGPATPGGRFANGAGGARSADLVIDGTTAAMVPFGGTGAWTTWSTRTLTVPMNASSNTIWLDPTSADGLPNIDHVTIGAT